MKAEDFANKYNLDQLGDRGDIVLNIQAIGEMLQNHTLDEISDIVDDMCNIK